MPVASPFIMLVLENTWIRKQLSQILLAQKLCFERQFELCCSQKIFRTLDYFKLATFYNIYISKYSYTYHIYVVTG